MSHISSTFVVIASASALSIAMLLIPFAFLGTWKGPVVVALVFISAVAALAAWIFGGKE